MRSRWPSVFSPLTQDLGKKELRTQQAVHHDEKNGTACCSNTTAPLSKMTSWTGQPPGSRARVREILCEGLRGRAFHVMGSFQTSAAHCESLASKLKEYGASGVTASRAVLKSILWEANPESSEVFILRVWGEVTGSGLSFFNRRGQKRRMETFGVGVEDVAWLDSCQEQAEANQDQIIGLQTYPKATESLAGSCKRGLDWEVETEVSCCRGQGKPPRMARCRVKENENRILSGCQNHSNRSHSRSRSCHKRRNVPVLLVAVLS